MEAAKHTNASLIAVFADVTVSIAATLLRRLHQATIISLLYEELLNGGKTCGKQGHLSQA